VISVILPHLNFRLFSVISVIFLGTEMSGSFLAYHCVTTPGGGHFGGKTSHSLFGEKIPVSHYPPPWVSLGVHRPSKILFRTAFPLPFWPDSALISGLIPLNLGEFRQKYREVGSAAQNFCATCE
jgi:hypothetical protein